MPPDPGRPTRLFLSVVALTMTAALFAARPGDSAASYLIPACLGGWLHLLLWNPLADGSRWWRREAAVALGTLLLYAVTGLLPAPVFPVVAGLFGIAGYACFLRGAVAPMTGRRLAVLMGVVVGLALAAHAWATGYHHVDNLDALAHQRAHGDPVYHAAQANMLLTHGTPTTGMHGLERVPNHIGSHWLVARWSAGFGVVPYALYPAVLGLVFVPLFLTGLCFVGLAARRAMADPADAGRVGLLTVLPLLAGIVGVLPVTVVDETRLFMSYWVSESGCLGIALWLLGCAAAADWHADTGGRVDKLFAVGFPALVAAATVSKISVGAVLLGSAGYAAVRLRLWRQWPAVLSGVAGIAAFYVIHKLTAAPTYGEATVKLVPFAYWRDLVPVYWWPWAVLMHAAGTILVCVIAVRRRGIHTLGDLRAAWTGRSLLLVEMVLVVAALGFAPGVVFRIFEGAAMYFQDCQRWLSIGLLTGLLWLAPCPPRPPAPWRVRLARAPVSDVALGGLLAVVMAAVGLNLLYGVRKLNRDVAVTHGRESADANPADWGGARQAIPTLLKGSLRRGLNLPAGPATAGERRDVVDQLLDLGRRPLAEKRTTFLFIPRTNRRYWDLLADPAAPPLAEDRKRMAVAFAAPALTGFAMLEGSPEYHPDAKFFGYGLDFVPKPQPFDHHATAAEREPFVKQAAESWGFRRVLVFDHSLEAGYSLTVWEW